MREFDEMMAAVKDKSELKHYGVPGMRWGKRKARGSNVHTPVEVKATPGKRVQARGGTGHSPHPDAIEKAANLQKARSSTTDSLSTPELKKLVERMNLEANYSKLNVQAPTKFQAGKKFALGIIKDEGQQALRGKKGPVALTIGTLVDAHGYAGKHRKH